MRTIPLWLALAACGGTDPVSKTPGPYVTALTPATGPWGSVVTIMGANFGEVPSPTNVVSFTSSVGANGFIIETWHDTKIEGRISFPATGAMTVQAHGGIADVGEFTTTMTYTPSSPIDVSAMTDGLVLSTGEVAGLYHTYELTNLASLAVFGGANAGAYTLDNLVDPNDKNAPVFGKVLEADDHTPEVIATKQDHMVTLFTLANRQVVATATGINGHVLAAGRDATGIYAWIDTDTGLVRARPGTPSWTTDRGPMNIDAHALDGAIAADGTLWLVESKPGTGQTATISIQTLGTSANQLSSPDQADTTAYVNEISLARLQLASDGAQAIITGTADAQGTPVTFARARDAGGAWAAAPALDGLVDYAFIGTTLGAVVNDAHAKTTSIVPDALSPATAQVIPVWPMQSAGVVVDGSGKVHPLLTNGSVTYALTPPSS
jgi:hypothetical protein